VILSYFIHDGMGNTLRLVVQAPNREVADLIVLNETDRAQTRGYGFPLADAEVTDLSSMGVIHEELRDHELGDDVAF